MQFSFSQILRRIQNLRPRLNLASALFSYQNSQFFVFKEKTSLGKWVFLDNFRRSKIKTSPTQFVKPKRHVRFRSMTRLAKVHGTKILSKFSVQNFKIDVLDLFEHSFSRWQGRG